ncbi:MAG: hypothetical protein KJ970_06830 [Candidatus Eisenbacteria bacterium]|uniref:Polysaccharide chain length determinant N-terminal domain-containing protein n=1 Tax=Eiseniibacteriota bacterium TaxID=2212470 RepID=A0A948RW32_UNCEI|nr:hypothetical protein [Candidatus Eisenbacteria bacterium]MBU1950142.1 hypothetical protein [Candidatus Eisenbacteria bacterium]MBU2690628.1 hypothetical protein [Candidatus Eisenbacteria bacterium]
MTPQQLEHESETNGYDEPPEPVERRRTSMRDFISVIFRRKGIVIVIIVIAIIAVLILNATSPTTFQSHSSLLVSRGHPQSVFSTGYQILSWEEELNSEVEIIKSQQIHQLAQDYIEDWGLRKNNGEPIKIDPLQIRATTPGKSSVINIAYRSHAQEETQHVAQALAQAYIDFRHQTRGGPEVESYFQQQLEQLEDRLGDWEQRRADYMTEEAVTSPKDERYFLLQERRDAQAELARIQSNITERQAQIESIRRLQEERRNQPDLQIMPFSNPTTNEESILDMLMKELTLRRSEYYSSAARYTENHPDVQNKRRHVLELESALDRELNNYLRHLEARIEVMLAQEANQTQVLEALSAELAEIPSKEMRLGQIDRVLAAMTTQYNALVQSSVDARIKKTGSADWNVILLTPASESIPILVTDYVRLAILPLFSIILGIGMAFLVDGLDHSIKDAGDVEAYIGLPVLASVSPFGGR